MKTSKKIFIILTSILLLCLYFIGTVFAKEEVNIKLQNEYQISTINVSSYDLTIAGCFGVSYGPPVVKNLLIFIEADYKVIFEKVKGQFLTPSLGLSYKF